MTKSDVIQVTLPEELMKKVDDEAQRLWTSKSAVVRRIVAENYQ